MIKGERLIDDLFSARRADPDQFTFDISEHLGYIKSVASNGPIRQVVEFGCRTGNSTLALLSGLSEGAKMFSYDIEDCPHKQIIKHAAKLAGIDWQFCLEPSHSCKQDADLVFIDSWHSYDQVKEELNIVKGMKSVSDIIFHDTELFGWFGQRDKRQGSGILPAILRFMCDDLHQRKKGWVIYNYFRNNNGLLHIKSIE